MKILTKNFFLIVLFVVILSFGYGFSCYIRRSSYNDNFEKIQVGDSKQTVIKQFGTPNEIVNCHDSTAKDELNRNCVEEYWYRSFMEQWGISFDKDGKIINKTYNVLY